MKHKDGGAEQRKRKSSDQKIRSVLMRKLGQSQQKSKNRKAAPTRTKKKSMQLKRRVMHVWKNRSREICSR